MDKSAEEPGRRAVSRWLVPLVIIAFCALAYYLTTTFDRVPPILKRGMQPADFPQLVILLIAVLAAWLAVSDREPAPAPLPPVVFLTAGLLVVFPLLALIDLFLALGALGLALSVLWGERRLWALAIVAVAVPAAVFFLFDGVFEIRFPRGILTNLWYG